MSIQRRTVEYAHRRLWEDEDSSRRFLVAEELLGAYAKDLGWGEAEDPAAMKPEKTLFKYSILYLFVLFGALVVDRMLLA